MGVSPAPAIRAGPARFVTLTPTSASRSLVKMEEHAETG